MLFSIIFPILIALLIHLAADPRNNNNEKHDNANNVDLINNFKGISLSERQKPVAICVQAVTKKTTSPLFPAERANLVSPALLSSDEFSSTKFSLPVSCFLVSQI